MSTIKPFSVSKAIVTRRRVKENAVAQRAEGDTQASKIEFALRRRLSRLLAISRHNVPSAIQGLTSLEQRAADARQYQLQLDALYLRFTILERQNKAHQLLNELSSALSLAKNNHLPQQASQILYALGRLHYTTGDYKEAVLCWIDCIATCTLTADNRSLIEARIGLAQVYDAMGDWHRGELFLQETATLLHGMDDLYLHCKLTINLAVNQRNLKKMEMAETLFHTALEQAKSAGISEYLAEAHWHLGTLAFLKSDLRRAQDEINTAAALANACSHHWLQSEIQLSLAKMFEAQAFLKTGSSQKTSIHHAIATYLAVLKNVQQPASLGQQTRCCAALSHLYEKIDDIRSALSYARQLQMHHETLSKMSTTDRFSELREVDLSQKSAIEKLLDLSVDRHLDKNQSSTYIHTIAARTLEILRINLVCIWLLETSSLSYVCHSLHSPHTLNFSVGDEYANAQTSPYIQLLKNSHHPLIVHDVRLHPAITEISNLYAQSGVQSLVEIPLYLHDQFIGIVSFGQCNQRRNWSHEDVLFCSHIASLLQQTLIHGELTFALNKVKIEAENRIKAEAALQQSFDKLKERNEDMFKLNTIGRELTGTLNMEQAFERVYKQVIAKLDAYVFGIGIYDKAEQHIRMVYLIENGQRQPDIIFKMSEIARPAVWCVREKQELRVSVRSELNNYVGSLMPVLFGSNTMQSLVYMPLLIGGDVIGCITVQSPIQNAFRPDQLEFLTALSNYAAIAVSNSIAHTKLAAAHLHALETQQQLVLQEKMAGLGTLTAGIAHEINNPTNFVHVAAQNLQVDIAKFKIFIAQLMQADEDPKILQAFEIQFAQLAEHVKTMLNGTNRIKNIVRDLRSFTRLGEAEKKQIHISECLHSTLNLVRTAWQNQVNFIINFDDDPEINCWPSLLNQVFMNLMVNGCQAIAEKQSKIHKYTTSEKKLNLFITLQRVNTNLLIHFEDEGVGMSEEAKIHAMEPFFTTKAVGNGTGLGLSIAYGIIEKHGGTLSFVSAVKVGSRFTVSLPIQTESSLEFAQDQIHSEAPSQSKR